MPTNLFFSTAAKVNLGLTVGQKLPNGYHHVNTVMIRVPIFDQISLDWLPHQQQLLVDCDDPHVPNNSKNLVYQAFKLLQQDYQLPAAHLSINKLIPVGAGLGGGSFNAGTLLTVLNQELKLNLSQSRLINYALKLGADVPFAASSCATIAEINHGLPQLKQMSLPIIPPSQLVLVFNHQSWSTKIAYEQIDQFPRHQANLQPLVDALVSGDLNLIGRHLHNDFYPGAVKKLPVLAELQQELLRAGAVGASLTGKGPTMFGLFPPRIDLSAWREREDAMVINLES